MTEPVWLPKAFFLRVHDQQIAQHGGLPGLRDEGLLESAILRPCNAFSYGETDTCTLAAMYAGGIIQNHPFLDGNKRTGFVAYLTFLKANGLELTAPMADRLAQTLMLAASEIDEAAYADWLKRSTGHAGG
ncbi:MAG: type II toxin-antitoxin system death-on-curing family toxin [Pseudomonadota bacterium]